MLEYIYIYIIYIFQIMQLGFGLDGSICQKHYVIGVVSVGNCFSGVPSAYFLCQLDYGKF